MAKARTSKAARYVVAVTLIGGVLGIVASSLGIVDFFKPSPPAAVQAGIVTYGGGSPVIGPNSNGVIIQK
jgi:hypothetical protein